MGKLRNTLAAISILLLASCGGNKDYYMFTSFHEPADEGLRYLYSEDGMHWDSIPGVWLKPELGQHRLMRDPSMVRTPDGTYHLVWTTSWKGDLGFGYANSKDLIHWSEQQMIPVMADEPTTVNVWAPEIFYDDESEQFMEYGLHVYQVVLKRESKKKRIIIVYTTSLQRILRQYPRRKYYMILVSAQSTLSL